MIRMRHYTGNDIVSFECIMERVSCSCCRLHRIKNFSVDDHLNEVLFGENNLQMKNAANYNSIQCSQVIREKIREKTGKNSANHHVLHPILLIFHQFLKVRTCFFLLLTLEIEQK